MNQPFQVPKEAFKEGKCECGCTIFDVRHHYQFYRGTLSMGNLCLVEELVYKCDRCGSVYTADVLFSIKGTSPDGVFKT